MTGQRRKIVLNTERAKHLINIKSDHEYGITHTLLKHKLTVDEWEDLTEFMWGQTQALAQKDDGSAESIIYQHDFRTWVEGSRNYDQ